MAMNKEKIQDILFWVIILCVFFMVGTLYYQTKTHALTNGLWWTMPAVIAIGCAVALYFVEKKS